MNGWAVKEVGAYPAGAQTVGASQTDTPISLEGWPITAGGATKGLVVKVKVSSVTASTGITAKLQTAIGDDYEDSKTVDIDDDGSFYIRLLPTVSGDQTYLPLLNKGRVVLTTGSGDTATIESVGVLQEL
jgi:hypothetical protein